MKFLFVHNNYPAQFRFLVEYLAGNGHEVIFLSLEKTNSIIHNVKHILIKPNLTSFFNDVELPFAVRGWSKKFDVSQYFLSSYKKLKSQGFYPDLVVTHAGWGAGYFVKSVFPNSKLAAYCEWWFKWDSDDSSFDISSPYYPKITDSSRVREQFVNMFQAGELSCADYCWTPTCYQKNQYPERLQNGMEVIHEGVEVNPGILREKQYLENFLPSSPITYATRGMEPMRGFEHFVNIAAKLLHSDLADSAFIAGKDKAFYRKLPPGALSMAQYAKKVFARTGLSSNRIKWSGLLDYENYKRLLSKSGLHFYFTRPFVPSWSLVDAMSSGCLIVSSDIACVREIVCSPGFGAAALLVDHTNHADCVNSIAELLDDPKKQSEMRQAAIEIAFQHFDCKKQLKQLISFLDLPS